MTDEREYYEGQAGPLMTFLRGLAVFVGVVTGIGAVFAAMNTMYAIVEHRTPVRSGRLRAIGFSRFSVLMSFMLRRTAALRYRRRPSGLPPLAPYEQRHDRQHLGEPRRSLVRIPRDAVGPRVWSRVCSRHGCHRESPACTARAARLPIISALGRA